MKQRLVAIALVFAICIFNVNSQEKYSKVKIGISSQKVKDFVFEHLEVDHFTFQNNEIIVTIDQEELKRLKSSGHTFQILVDDVVKQTLENNRRRSIEKKI